MFKRHEFANADKLRQRRAFPARIISLDQSEALGRKDKEAAIDQAAVAAWLFREGRDLVALQLERTITASRVDGGYGAPPAVVSMKCNLGRDVDIGQTVAVGEAEGLFILHVSRHAL